MTDTATTMGYISAFSTPRLMPSEAMMKANSPIWVSEKPDSMATFRGWPVTSMPKVPNVIMPAITTADSSSIGHQYWTRMAGCTIMPTEMKNTEPKRSLTGMVTCSMRSA